MVDDDREFRAAIGALLTRAGYETTCVSNGREALDRLERDEPPALILLDVEMPVMDGEGFRAEQLKVRRARTIPVVIVSGDSETGAKAERMGLPYLVKPIDGRALLAAVGKYAAVR